MTADVINHYALTLALLGAVVLVCQTIFLILFRPGWKVLGLWWINVALYCQAISLALLGLRTAVVYFNRLDVPSTLSTSQQVGSLVIALLAAIGSVVFVVGYLLNRDWGTLSSPRTRREKKRERE